MLKNILIYGLLCTLLSAEGLQEKPVSFEIFLNEAIKDSPYLHSSTLAVQQAKESGDILTRYENPSLELAYSDFSPDIGSRANGYRVSYTQPIRLWNIADAKKSLAKGMLDSAKATFSQKKAIFIRDISLAYSSYIERVKLLTLAKEELEIAKTIYDISKERYDSGTISRGLILQAKIDYETIKIATDSLALQSQQTYYQMLKFAGITRELKLQDSYSFELLKKSRDIHNPNIEILQAQHKKALSQIEIDSKPVEWINAFAEYEVEPDQNIARVGVNFPLAVFNMKSQEKRIANLQVSRVELLIDNEEKSLQIEQNRLQNERKSLKVLRLENENVLVSELELLTMFQNGYKIANINLLQLQAIKNRLISTKKNIIQIPH